jgi:hypothetical protein
MAAGLEHAAYPKKHRMKLRAMLFTLLHLLLLFNSCTSGRGVSSPASFPSTTRSSRPSDSATVRSGVTTWVGAAISENAIPLGEGKISTSPRIGYEDSCQTSFGSGPGGAGASAPPWIDSGAGTWNLREKVTAQGSVRWASASHSFTRDGAARVIRTNDLPDPSQATTGTFPISSTEPAYEYDRNPNAVQARSFDWTLPTTPTAASEAHCVGMGPIAVATDGVVMFNALDAQGRDAGAHEVQDSCGGHPQEQGIYHYHFFSPCLAPSTTTPGSSTLVGYALDGYGIFAERDSVGHLPTDADLDACHGRTSTVEWDGRSISMYHYDVTLEYPYLVGCFHGTPIRPQDASSPPGP